MNKALQTLAVLAIAIFIAQGAYAAAEPLPGDSCTAGEEDNFLRSGGKEIPTGHFIVCKSGTWRSILSWDAAAAVTKIGNLTCTNGQILKFNGTTWGCAADSGGTLPALNAANIWVGNASNAATAVAMSGDATLSNAGVLTIGNNAIGSAEITDGSIANGDLAGSIALSKLATTGTASSSVFLRGDGAWTALPAATAAGSSGHVQFNSSNAMAGDSGLFWNNTTKRLGIGTSSPLTDLHVQNTGLYLPQLRLEHVGDSAGYFILTKAKGTPAAKTAVESGENLGYVLGQGYDGAADINSAFLAFTVDGPVSTGVVPGAFNFVTMNSAGSTSSKMTLSSDGKLGLGISPTSNRLEVSGTASATSFAGSGALLTALNASNLGSGTVPTARLGTGTASATTYLRGDNTWATLPSSADNLGNHTATATLNMQANQIQMSNSGTNRLYFEPQSGFYRAAFDRLTFWDHGAGADIAELNDAVGSTGVAGLALKRPSWNALMMDGNASTKSLVMHYGGDADNQLRFGKYADNLGGWEANVALLDIDNGNFWTGGSVTAASFAGNGAGLTGVPGDNLGNHTATTNINLGANALVSNAGTILDANGGYVRTYGNTGWYNGTHGGGWFMQDTSWLRSYGDKNIFTGSVVRADAGFQVDGNAIIDGNGAITSPGDIVANGGMTGSNYSNNSIAIHAENGGAGYGARLRYGGSGTNASIFQIQGTSDNVKLTINGSNVGIGSVTAPSHILHIPGQGRATNSAWATSSDRRVKENIHNIESGLETIDKLRPVTFHYTEEYQNGNPAMAGIRRGFIAQEVEAVIPDMVTKTEEKFGDKTIPDFRVLGNSDFVPLLVSAVKELKAANEAQAEEIDELREELKTVKAAQ